MDFGHEGRQGGSEVDDPFERRIAHDEEDVALLKQLAGAAGKVRQEPAGVDHHVGVETPQRCGHHRPGLLIGGGTLDAREAEEYGQTTGEMVDVVPDGIGGERAPGRGEE